MTNETPPLYIERQFRRTAPQASGCFHEPLQSGIQGGDTRDSQDAIEWSQIPHGKGVQSFGKLLKSQMDYRRRLPNQIRIPQDHGIAHNRRR